MQFTSAAVTVDLPDGWEASIDGGDGAWRSPDTTTEPPTETQRPDGSVRRLVAHFANFPLPAVRGDYGDGAIETMRSGDLLIALLEFDPLSAEEQLFSSEGVPTELRPSDFHPEALHVPQFGATAAQRFFTVSGRPFSLYVVIGSHIDRADDISVINQVLASLVFA